MTLLRYSVGIDMAKKDFKACLCVIDHQQKVTIKASRTFANTPKAFPVFLRWVIKGCKEPIPYTFTVEATGVYHEPLAWYLYGQQQTLAIVLPTKAKRYLQSLGYRSKTDKIDAIGIARMGAEQHLTPWHPISKTLYILRSQTRHLESLQNTKTILNNQLEACQHGMFSVKEVVRSLQKSIKHLEREIDAIKKTIIATLQQDAELRSKAEKIISIKGVSWITAAVVIAETNGFALFENQRQLTSYAGYDVVENQSGQFKGKSRISKKGNTHLRRAMHMCSLVVVSQKVVPFSNLYQRVYQRSACKMKGYVAVQRKLLLLIYTLWKKDQYYDQNYTKTTSVEHESGPSFPEAAQQTKHKTAADQSTAALDKLPYDQSSEAFFPVE